MKPQPDDVATKPSAHPSDTHVPVVVSYPSPAPHTAMHMPGSTKHIPQGLGGLPGMTAFATHMLKKQIAEQEVPEVPEFLQLLHDMGARMWACKMSVDMMGLTKDDMFDGVEDIINVNEFIELTDGAQVIFV